MQFLFFKWIDDRVGASPDAAWSPIQVTGEPMAAAMGQDAPGLVGQVFGRVYHLDLQANPFVHMLAILYFQGFPGFFSHLYAPFSN
jgi:hypothetical protein